MHLTSQIMVTLYNIHFYHSPHDATMTTLCRGHVQKIPRYMFPGEISLRNTEHLCCFRDSLKHLSVLLLHTHTHTQKDQFYDGSEAMFTYFLQRKQDAGVISQNFQENH